MEEERRKRLARFYKTIAIRLEAAATQPTFIAALVDETRIAAWEEMSDAWRDNIMHRGGYEAGIDYARSRAGRIQELAFIDLAALFHHHGIEPP